MLVELVHVEFEARDKHDVKQTDRGEKVNRGIFLNEEQAMRADYHPGKDKPDDTRDLESVQDNRRQQNNKKDKRENQDRVAERCMEFVKQLVYKFLHPRIFIMAGL